MDIDQTTVGGGRGRVLEAMGTACRGSEGRGVWQG